MSSNGTLRKHSGNFGLYHAPHQSAPSCRSWVYNGDPRNTVTTAIQAGVLVSSLELNCCTYIRQTQVCKTWIKPDASGNRLNYPNIIQYLQRRTKIFECKLQHPATASTEPGWSMACKPLQRIPMNAMFRSLASCTRLIQIHPDSQTSSNSKSSLAPSANTFATVT